MISEDYFWNTLHDNSLTDYEINSRLVNKPVQLQCVVLNAIFSNGCLILTHPDNRGRTDIEGFAANDTSDNTNSKSLAASVKMNQSVKITGYCKHVTKQKFTFYITDLE